VLSQLPVLSQLRGERVLLHDLFAARTRLDNVNGCTYDVNTCPELSRAAVNCSGRMLQTSLAVQAGWAGAGLELPGLTLRNFSLLLITTFCSLRVAAVCMQQLQNRLRAHCR
jgi:hypothetical protein